MTYVHSGYVLNVCIYVYPPPHPSPPPPHLNAPTAPHRPVRGCSWAEGADRFATVCDALKPHAAKVQVFRAPQDQPVDTCESFESYGLKGLDVHASFGEGLRACCLKAQTGIGRW